MAKYAIAKQLAGKRIITTDGEELGRVVDLNVDELTGKLESVIVEANPDSSMARKAAGDTASIPYGAVIDVKDVMVVDRRALAAQTA